MRRWSIAGMRRRQDELFASFLVVGTTITWAVSPATHSPVGVGGLLLTLAGAALLAWRRRAPVLVPLLSYTAVAACFLLTQTGVAVFSQLIIFIAGYTTISAASSVAAVVVRVAACVAGVALVIRVAIGDTVPALVEAIGIVAALTAVTLLAKRASTEKHQLATDVALAAAEAERRERDAVTAERIRIARDLHDVVSHSITVSILQARGGRKILNRDPGGARAAFDTIESISEQALVEMRRMLGVLRNEVVSTDDEQPMVGSAAAAPSLGQLDSLLAIVPPTVTVDLVVTGDPATLPATVDITAFRILQEAITNVIKHSDARRVAISVVVEPGVLRIEVRDDGSRLERDSGGFGIIGMRERVATFGGSFSADFPPGSGFVVTAALPFGEAA